MFFLILMPFLSHLILWHIFSCKTLPIFQGNPWIHRGFQIHIERKRNLRKVPMTLQWQPGLKKSQKPSILLKVAFYHCNMTCKLKQGQKYHEGFFLKTSWKWFQCIDEDKFDSTDCYRSESIGERILSICNNFLADLFTLNTRNELPVAWFNCFNQESLHSCHFYSTKVWGLAWIWWRIF